MKSLLALAIAAFFMTAGSVFASESEVNFAKVNPVLQSLLDPIIGKDDVVEYAMPQFDTAYSDLQKERLKYDLTGSMKSTPWLSGGRAEVSASATYSVDRTAGHTGFTVTGSKTTKTDILALFRYAAKVALKEDSFHDPIVGARLKAHMQRLYMANSLDELYTLIFSGKSLAVEGLQNEVKKHQEWLACTKTDTCGGSYPPDMTMSERIKNAERELKYLESAFKAVRETKIEVEMKNNQVRSIAITVPGVTGYEQNREDRRVESGPVSVTLNEEALTVGSSVTALTDVQELDKFKSRLQTKLLGAQEGDLKQKKKIEQNYRDALVKFKKFIRGNLHP